MSELKTLRELADEVGFPFEAVSYVMGLSNLTEQCDRVKFAAVSPQEMYFGWRPDGSYYVISDSRSWSLAPKKKVLKSFVYQNKDESVHIYSAYIESPEAFCTRWDKKLIKILDEIEVDL